MSRTLGTQRPRRKAKKSYTLSPESVAFLETLRKKRRAPSISSVLEQVLESVRRAHERAALDKAVAGYYDSLQPEEVDEQTRWGEFSLREWPDEAV
jgi:hypothetical protein